MKHVVIKIGQSPAILVIKLLVIASASLGVYFLVFAANRLLSLGGLILPSFPWLAGLAIFLTILIQLVLTFYTYFYWQNFYYMIDDVKIVSNYGIFYKKHDDNVITGLDDVTYNQSFLGRIFNFGDIVIAEPRTEERIILAGIHDPEKYTHLILERFADKNEG